MFEICHEHPLDASVVEQLLDNVFGAERHCKASYALREHVAPIHDLCFIARADDEKVIGTVRFWPVVVNDMLQKSSANAILLGPLAVSCDARGQNIGAALVWHAIERAELMGYDRILLVGEENYYAQFGFRSTLPSYISLPGGRDARRLLVRQSGTCKSLPAVGRVEPVLHCSSNTQPSMLVAAE